MKLKYKIIVTGLILIVLNSIARLFFRHYTLTNNVLGDISIVLTILILYGYSSRRRYRNYRTSLCILFTITGLVRFFLALKLSLGQGDNNLIFTFSVIAIEMLFIVYFSSPKFLTAINRH